MPKYKIPIAHRFYTKYKISKNGCWEWKGAKRNDGYGTLKINGKQYGAHRFSFMLYIGEISNDLLVCHKCDNPICVNPFHLFSGTHKDNRQDASNKGRLGCIPGGNHGTKYRYGKGCRCDECTYAVKINKRKQRAKKNIQRGDNRKE